MVGAGGGVLLKITPELRTENPDWARVGSDGVASRYRSVPVVRKRRAAGDERPPNSASAEIAGGTAGTRFRVSSEKSCPPSRASATARWDGGSFVSGGKPLGSVDIARSRRFSVRGWRPRLLDSRFRGNDGGINRELWRDNRPFKPYVNTAQQATTRNQKPTTSHQPLATDH